jgi:glycosyltransferase involved in cell wall biosynthesis
VPIETDIRQRPQGRASSAEAKAGPRVSIALATYNGHKYLGDLLKSLRAQTWPQLDIVVFDDASSDNTVEIIEAHQERLNLKITVNARRAGVIANFDQALGACTADYIALADQDDVWRRDKVSKLMTRMLEVEAEVGRATPILIFSNMQVVSSNLRPIKPFKIFPSVKAVEANQTVGWLLLRNYISGCSMLMNRALLDRAHPTPDGFFMHDWWIALVAATFGVVRGVDDTLLQYRQHAVNTYGIQKVPPILAYRGAKARRTAYAKYLARARVSLSNMNAYETRFGSELPEKAARELATLKAALERPLPRLSFLFQRRARFNIWAQMWTRARLSTRIAAERRRATDEL